MVDLYSMNLLSLSLYSHYSSFVRLMNNKSYPKQCMFLQETYVVEDCFKYDPTIQTRTTTHTSDTLTPIYNDFSFLSDNFSLECTWQLSNTGTEGIGFGIAPKNQTTPYHHLLFGIGTGQVSSYVGNQSGGETVGRYGSPSWNTEHQMKIEYTDGTVKLYIDDELKTTYTGRTWFNGETRDIVFLEWNNGQIITLKNIKLKAL